MPRSFKNLLTSGPAQLNVIGVVLLIILGLGAWGILQKPFTWFSLLPLLFIGYAAWSVIFELTINRANVPSLATCFIGRRKIAEILQTEASRRNAPITVIDLGSGRGQLTRVIAKKIPSANVIGIEIARSPCAQAALIQRLFGPKNLSYQCCDFWPYDCSKIDAVVFYLTPTIAQRVGEKLARELKPGSIVISHTFPLGGAWTPAEVVTFHSPFKETLYVYRK